MIADHSPVPRDPWLSILVPVYNVADYLEDCVRSIVDQLGDAGVDGDGVELLLLDDCSTDGSLALAERLCAEHPRHVEVIRHTQNGGLSKARNSLLDAARGNHVWFLDSDDYLLPGSLATLRTIIADHDPDLILCDYRKRRFLRKKSFPGSGRKLATCPKSLVGGVFEYRKMYSWLKIARRDLWGDDLRFPEGRWFEDIATTPDLLLRAKSHYYVPETWVHYRIRPNSIMTAITRTRGSFDAAGNLDMATAMLGYGDRLRQAIGEPDANIRFQASHFIAQEFVKLVKRYDLAKRTTPAAMESVAFRPYVDAMEQSSLLSFGALLRQYRARFNIVHYGRLRRALRIVKTHVG